MEEDFRLVNNHAELVAVFGDWPSFHDAEVLSLILDRSERTLDVAFYVFRTSGEHNSAGQFIRSDEVLVRMRFYGISELSLFDFNEQNVLSDLSLIEESTEKRVRLHGLYGLSGSFLCKAIEVCGVERLPERTQ